MDEAIQLNRALVHQPFAKDNITVKLRYDLLDYWHKVRGGEQAMLREAPMHRRSTARPSPTTTSRNGAARSSGGATRRAPTSMTIAPMPPKESWPVIIDYLFDCLLPATNMSGISRS